MKLLHTKAFSEDVSAIALCPVSDLLAVATQTSVGVYRNASLFNLFNISVPNPVTTISWSGNGRLLAFAAGSAIAIVLVDTGEILRTFSNDCTQKQFGNLQQFGNKDTVFQPCGEGKGHVTFVAWCNIPLSVPVPSLNISQTHQNPASISDKTKALLLAAEKEWVQSRSVVLLATHESGTVTFILGGLWPTLCLNFSHIHKPITSARLHQSPDSEPVLIVSSAEDFIAQPLGSMFFTATSIPIILQCATAEHIKNATSAVYKASTIWQSTSRRISEQLAKGGNLEALQSLLDGKLLQLPHAHQLQLTETVIGSVPASPPTLDSIIKSYPPSMLCSMWDSLNAAYAEATRIVIAQAQPSYDSALQVAQFLGNSNLSAQHCDADESELEGAWFDRYEFIVKKHEERTLSMDIISAIEATKQWLGCLAADKAATGSVLRWLFRIVIDCNQGTSSETADQTERSPGGVLSQTAPIKTKEFLSIFDWLGAMFSSAGESSEFPAIPYAPEALEALSVADATQKRWASVKCLSLGPKVSSVEIPNSFRGSYFPPQPTAPPSNTILSLTGLKSLDDTTLFVSGEVMKTDIKTSHLVLKSTSEKIVSATPETSKTFCCQDLVSQTKKRNKEKNQKAETPTFSEVKALRILSNGSIALAVDVANEETCFLLLSSNDDESRKALIIGNLSGDESKNPCLLDVSEQRGFAVLAKGRRFALLDTQDDDDEEEEEEKS